MKPGSVFDPVLNPLEQIDTTSPLVVQDCPVGMFAENATQFARRAALPGPLAVSVRAEREDWSLYPFVQVDPCIEDSYTNPGIAGWKRMLEELNLSALVFAVEQHYTGRRNNEFILRRADLLSFCDRFSGSKPLIMDRNGYLVGYEDFFGLLRTTLGGQEYRYHALMTEGEVRELYRLAGEASPENAVVEVGRCGGGSTIALAAGMRDAGRGDRLWSLDIVPLQITAYLLKKAGLRERVELLTADDIAVASLWPSLADGRKVGLLFIDGDHSYESATADFLHWHPRLDVGGLVAFHDCNAIAHPGVAKAVYRHVVGNPSYEFVRKTDSIYVARKVAP